MAQIKYLDLTGLSSFWTKVKSYIDKADALKVDKTIEVNGHALSDNVTIGGGDVTVGGTGDHSAKTVQKAIEDLDAAVKAAAASGVQSFGGKTGAIAVDAAAGAVAGDGKVKFVMAENMLTATVDLSSKADKTTTVNGKPLSDDITLAGADITVGGEGTYASDNIQAAIEGLDTAVKAEAAKVHVDSIGGKTGAITLKAGSVANGDINLAISEDKELSASIVGLGSAAYTSADDYADAVHTHATSDVTGLDAALAEKATKAVALKEVTGSATAGTDKVTVTVNTKTESDSTTSTTFDLPVADDTNQGTTTLGKIREIAKVEAATAAGSTYRVKGTKANISDVTSLTEAAIGDVWNVTNEFTLNGQKFPAGTNVVCIEAVSGDNAETKWDALGGTVDLTPYATTEYVNGELAKKANADAVVSSFGGQKGAITVDNDNAEGEGNGKVNFTMSGTELQGTVVGLKSAAYTDSSAYATADHDHAIEDVTGLQEALNAKVATTDLIAISEGEITALPGLGA